jgi:hypothetical protein
MKKIIPYISVIAIITVIIFIGIDNASSKVKRDKTDINTVTNASQTSLEGNISHFLQLITSL